MDAIFHPEYGVQYGVTFLVGFLVATLLNKRSAENVENIAPNDAPQGGKDELKMVLVVNNGLKMGKGKIAAQCSHAAVGCYKKAVKATPQALKQWEELGQAKVVVKVEDDQKLMQIYKDAKKAGLNADYVMDAGRTQIAAGSRTAVCIGPASKSEIDKITGNLKLL